MKSTTIAISVLWATFCCYTLHAQTGYPNIISVNADSKALNGIWWDWSFGEELLINTLQADKNFMLTTGFLQNDFGVGVNFKQLELTTVFKIGPNPIIQNVKITGDQIGILISKIEIINEQGQLVKNIQGPFSGIQFEQTLSFASVNTGIYFILIHYVVGNSIFKKQIFKIIKQQ